MLRVDSWETIFDLKNKTMAIIKVVMMMMHAVDGEPVRFSAID